MFTDLEVAFYCLLAGVSGFCVGALFAAWLWRAHFKRQNFVFEHKICVHVEHHRESDPPDRMKDWKHN